MNTNISRYNSFSGILKEYQNCLKWIESFEIKIEQSRLKTYEKLFKNIELINKSTIIPEYRDHKIQEKAKEIYNALYEIYCFLFIYNSFNRKSINGLKEKLFYARSGPEEYTKETKNSNSHRNTIYELLVAASLSNRNYPIDLSTETDIVTEINGVTTFIECKRPKNADRLEEHYRKGIEQLHTRFKSAKKCYGILFISLDKVINPKFNQPSFPSKEIFDEHLKELIHAYFQENVIKKVKIKYDKKYLGEICQILVPGYIENLHYKYGLGSFTLGYTPHKRDDSLFKYFLETYLMGWNNYFYNK